MVKIQIWPHKKQINMVITQQEVSQFVFHDINVSAELADCVT